MLFPSNLPLNSVCSDFNSLFSLLSFGINFIVYYGRDECHLLQQKIRIRFASLEQFTRFYKTHITTAQNDEKNRFPSEQP